MALLEIGYLFVVIGFIVAISGGGIPPFGFRTGFRLFMEYKAKRAGGGEPTLDQKGAYYTFLSYGIAGICIFSGVIFLVLGKILRG